MSPAVALRDLEPALESPCHLLSLRGPTKPPREVGIQRFWGRALSPPSQPPQRRQVEHPEGEGSVFLRSAAAGRPSHLPSLTDGLKRVLQKPPHCSQPDWQAENRIIPHKAP